MTAGYFITGTDTGVGKTLITSALVGKFASHGLKAVGMKPIAAGCSLVDGQLLSEDVTQLIAASNVSAPLEQINPYAFEPAIAPHIAAVQAKVEIELGTVMQAYAALANISDVVVVEGVGGFCVPLGDHLDTADLAQALDLPVILVVGMRLGCLSHALLTVAAIRSRGLKLRGWVANTVDPGMDMLEENLQSLVQRIDAPCIGVVPWQEKADFDAAAGYLSNDLLIR
jgi:dethiobiotin synthetase